MAQLRDLERAVSRLTRAQRDVWGRRQILGETTTEVAERLGISEATVKSRLQRARESIARTLGEDRP